MAGVVIYWLVLITVIVVEYALLAERWERYELARRAVGIATVMLGALPLVGLGYLDWWTWLILFVGFLVAGTVTTGLYLEKWERERREKVGVLKERLGTLYETSADPE
jgi:uncharacterized membrane protein